MSFSTTGNMKKRKHHEAYLLLAVYMCGLLTGLFLSPLLLFLPSNLDTKCNENFVTVSHSLTREPSVHLMDTLRNPDESPPSDDGWKQIHVFYGNNSHIDDASDIRSSYFRVNRWFSQYRQDEVVMRLLNGKRNGYFLDLASNDAVRISNTYALETYFGWNGICLEPNPTYWNGLAYRKCDVAAAVIGMTRMEEVAFKFPKDKGPKGGIVGDDFRNKDSPSRELQRRYTIKLFDVLQRFGAPEIIDYLSLDVEGAEDLVMSAFPFDRYRFNILTVERPSESLSKILESNGYELLKVLKIGKETLWVHTSVKDSLNMSALTIDTQNFKYQENKDMPRIAPEEKVTNDS